MVCLGGACLDDLARLARRLTLGERVDMFHAFGHFTPHSVLTVKKARIVKADEELAVGAVRALRTGH